MSQDVVFRWTSRFVWCALAVCLACSDVPTAESQSEVTESGSSAAPGDRLSEVRPSPGSEDYIEKGDLDALRRRGRIRFVKWREPERGFLPRNGLIENPEENLAREFAEHLGLEVVTVPGSSRREAVDLLLEGRADVSLGRRTEDVLAIEGVDLTMPFRKVRAQVITRAKDSDLDAVSGLAGRRIAYQETEGFPRAIAQLKQEAPGLVVESVPEQVRPLDLIDRVATAVKSSRGSTRAPSRADIRGILSSPYDFHPRMTGSVENDEAAHSTGV